MPAETPPLRKPLKWVGSSRKSLAALPEDVQDVFGSALLDVQYGDTPDGARPFGEGLPHEIWKIVEDFDGDTYRAVYTAAFPEVVYVLDAFMKKSKAGIKTPQADKDRVLARFKAAQQDYRAHHRRKVRTVMAKTTQARAEQTIAIEASSGNVFEDLGLPQAGERLAKAELARGIRHIIQSKRWTQRRAAEVLAIAPPDVSDLMRGKLARFSQERLERFLNALDMDVQIRVRPRAAGKKQADVTVEFVAV